MLFEYLLETYGQNEPIFVSDIRYQDWSTNYIRQQVKKLTDEGKMRRYDTGIYFIPKPSPFRSGSQLSRDKVITQKYLTDNGKLCGYVGGVMFANQLGLTTQVPMICEVTTNKATNDYREVKLASSVIALRRPRLPVTESNYKQLQLLDLLKDIDFLSEEEGDEQKRRIVSYMKSNGLAFRDLEQYLPYYPDRLFRNMYEVGLLNGLSS